MTCSLSDGHESSSRSPSAADGWSRRVGVCGLGDKAFPAGLNAWPVQLAAVPPMRAGYSNSRTCEIGLSFTVGSCTTILYPWTSCASAPPRGAPSGCAVDHGALVGNGLDGLTFTARRVIWPAPLGNRRSASLVMLGCKFARDFETRGNLLPALPRGRRRCVRRCCSRGIGDDWECGADLPRGPACLRSGAIV
jgi:hypothetical protein